MQIIIIGGGIAGTTAAEEIKVRDPKVEVTIIAAEEHPCYSRVLLPHYVMGKVGREKVFLKSVEWYAEHGIEFMSGVRVNKIDTKNKFVLTSEGRELPFDKLLITTGTEVSLMPDDKRGVSYLSTIEDADHLLALLSEFRLSTVPSKQAVVYGSGFIACEYANIFSHLGVPFVMVLRGKGFWQRQLSTASQQVLLDHLKRKNVQVYLGEPIEELLGEDELVGVRLKNGVEVAASILGCGIGVRAHEAMIVESGIPCAEGILANNYLETGVKDVYTAGDAAEFEDTVVNRRVRYGNWMCALTQGRTVAKTMTGERTPFALVSSYSISLLGLQIVFIGDVNREQAEVVSQTVLTEHTAEEVFVRDGKLVGAVLIGDMKNRATLTKAIGQPYGT